MGRKGLIKKLVTALFVLLSTSASAFAGQTWSQMTFAAGGASLSGNGYAAKSTVVLRYNVLDVQKSNWSFLLSVSGTPNTDSQFGDLKLLGFYGHKAIQLGSGVVAGELDATARDTWLNSGLPGLSSFIAYDPTRKVRTAAIGIPVAIRLVPYSSEKTLFRITGYYTIWGAGTARIPVKVVGVGDAYVKTKNGKGRYMGVEASYLRRIGEHLIVGVTGFWTRGEAYDLEYREELFGYLKGHAPDTDFDRAGGFFVTGWRF